MRAFAILLLALPSSLWADDITLKDGSVLKNARIAMRDDSNKSLTIIFGDGCTAVVSMDKIATASQGSTPPPPQAVAPILQRIDASKAKYLSGTVIGVYREGVLFDCTSQAGLTLPGGDQSSTMGRKEKHFGGDVLANSIADTPGQAGAPKAYVFGRFLVKGLPTLSIGETAETPAIQAGTTGAALTSGDGQAVPCTHIPIYQVVLTN